MKTSFVAELQDGQNVTSLFLVCEKEIRSSQSTGKPYLTLTLADRTGTIKAKMWENFAEPEKTFDCEDIVRVRGRVKLYRGERELTIDQILPAVEADYTLDDFLPHTKSDVRELFVQLSREIEAMRNPWLKALLHAFLEDPEMAAKLKRAPAAMTMHHAYLGGLLEHIVSLCGLAGAVAAHYPEIDGDLLLTGIVLHDIGKTEELSYKRAIAYSTEGQLLGHIVIGLGMVREKIAAIRDFPRSLAVLVEHLIVSHHGSYEFGSPKLPATREAVLLNHLDDLDSKMAAMRETLGQAQADALWSERNAALRRTLLNAAAYLRLDGNSEPRSEGQFANRPGAAALTKLPGPSADSAKAGGLFGATVTSTAPLEKPK